MEKNENGYPQGRVAPGSSRNGSQNGSTGDQSGRMNGSQNGTENGGMNGTGIMNGTGNGNMNGTGNGNMNGNGNTSGRNRDNDAVPHSMQNGCGDMLDNCLDSRPLAYVYAPNQRFCMLYSAKDALDHGTLFESLYKPMEVYGRE